MRISEQLEGERTWQVRSLIKETVLAFKGFSMSFIRSKETTSCKFIDLLSKYVIRKKASIHI